MADDFALYSSVGTGRSRRLPRIRLLYLVVQTQGIVGVITAVVSAAFIALATAGLGSWAWVAGAIAFVVTLMSLFAYWQLSLQALFRSLRLLNPSPAAERRR